MIDCGCKDANIHDEIFVRGGRSLKFTIMNLAVPDWDLLWELHDAITAHGGIVIESDKNTDFVLAMIEDRNQFKCYQDTYALSLDPKRRRIRVKEADFVKDSVKNGTMIEEMPKLGGKPGFPIGRMRTEFTREEDEKLTEFLAIHCPHGGRTSLQLYERLCSSAELGTENLWARSHPPSSWRERYRRSRPKFDPKIEQYIIEHHVHEISSDENDEEDLPLIEQSDDGEQELRSSPRRQSTHGSSDAVNGSERDPLFSEEEGPDDREALKDFQQTQEEEDEVSNELHQISHSTEHSIAHTSSKSHNIPQETTSINTSRPNLPTATTEPAKKWPPYRSHRRTSGVLTAPPAVTVRARTLLSGKGKEKASDKNEDGDEEEEKEEEQEQEQEEEDGDEEDEEDQVDELEDDDNDLEYHQVGQPRIDEEHHQEEEIPYGRDDEQVIPHKDNIYHAEEEPEMVDIEPILIEWNAEDYRPVRVPHTTSHNTASGSSATRQVAARTLPPSSPAPTDDPDSNVEQADDISLTSASPPPLSTTERKRVVQRRKRKNYHQIAEDGPQRVTRSRLRAASTNSQPPKKTLRRSKRQAQTKRSRENRVILEDTDEEMVSPNSEQEVEVEVEMDHRVQAPDARRGDDEVEITSDDEQSLRVLGVTIPEQPGRSIRRAGGQVRTLRDVTSSRQQSVRHTTPPQGSRSTRRSKPFLSPASSTTTGESFPRPGTRASAIKRKYVSKERQTPYAPPAGTRAADHIPK